MLMRSIHLSALLLTLLCSAAAAAAPTVLVLGDSLSAAYGIEQDQGWVSLLEKKLQRESIPARVVNASISGNSSTEGRNRLPALLEKFKPGVVIIELGGNDGLRGFPIGALRKNLADMAQQSRAAGARVLLLGIRIPPNYGPRYSDMFHRVYPQLAEEHDLKLVPFFLHNVATVPGLMQADGIHPTAEAQSKLLDNVWPDLYQLLDNQQVAHDQLQ